MKKSFKDKKDADNRDSAEQLQDNSSIVPPVQCYLTGNEPMKDDPKDDKAREIEEVRLFREGDERKYLAAIRRAGLKDGTPEFAHAVEVFRQHHRRN